VKHVLRPVPLGAAFVVLASAIVVSAHFDAAWWLIAFGVIGPDLSFLAAVGQPAGDGGQMPTRAVRPYNLAHHPAGPTLALTVGAMLRSPTLGALSLAWASHLLWDRGVGYGMRAGDGSIIAPPIRRTHIVPHLAHGVRREPGSRR